MKKLLTFFAILLISNSCTVGYKFSNASLPRTLETGTIVYFQNMATMVVPSLAPTFNDQLSQKILRGTHLRLVREGGDIQFEGQIIDYRSDPVAANQDGATMNRLTIAIKVKYTNTKTPGESYDRTFSEYADYPSQTLLLSVEGELIPQIVEKLIDRIFNEAFSQW